ncbi:MAG: glycosyltransferase family 4 protein [Planctomycetales bacterium]|nr:glycosyltransferase family 4 protein [Planctomycetales bacterium]
MQPISSTAFSNPTELFVAATNDRKNEKQPVLGKVLHVINGEHFSGAERVQQLLGKRLDQYGFETSFACIKPGRFREHCELRESQLNDFPMAGRLDFSIVSQIARKVVAEEFDLLHAHTPRSSLITAMVAHRTKRPWLYHVHSPTSRDSTRGVVNRINQWIESYSVRSADRILTVSKSLRREMLKRGVQRRRLSVVPNGVPAIEPIDCAARKHSQRWRVGMLALMRPRKGVEIALQAMRLLRDKHIPISLDLIGGFETKEYEDQILWLIESMGLSDSVTWRGFTREVPLAISKLDALVLPSLFGEGMPMVVLEALAAGVPVVATRVEGTPEVVRHGIEGLLAKPCDANDLATQLHRLVSDRDTWSNMSQAAVLRHRSHFSDDRMAQRVARAYEATLS